MFLCALLWYLALGLLPSISRFLCVCVSVCVSRSLLECMLFVQVLRRLFERRYSLSLVVRVLTTALWCALAAVAQWMVLFRATLVLQAMSPDNWMMLVVTVGGLKVLLLPRRARTHRLSRTWTSPPQMPGRSIANGHVRPRIANGPCIANVV